MQQQPLLTADEVIELLEKHVITTEAEREAFQQLLDDSKLTNAVLSDPDTQFPLLVRGREFLMSKGIYVYFGIEDFSQWGLNIYCRFIAGECARVYHKLVKQSRYLNDLFKFVCKHEDKLPQHIRSKTTLLTHYILETEHFPISSGSLLETYIRSNKRKLKKICEEGWELVKKVDTFLENVKDLQHMFAIETLL
jgi:hypothetical protein